MDNETWIVEEGDRIIRKKARLGPDRLTDWERLVYSLWVADYGMRNAGDIGTARDVYADFQSVALHAANVLSLPTTRRAFALARDTLQARYFDLFEAVWDEIRSAEPGAGSDGDQVGFLCRFAHSAPAAAELVLMRLEEGRDRASAARRPYSPFDGGGVAID